MKNRELISKLRDIETFINDKIVMDYDFIAFPEENGSYSITIKCTCK